MKFNAGAGWDVAPFDVQIVGYLAGLKLFKCATWEEGVTHGGDISANEVDTMFDYITDAQDVSGYTDYRKVHAKNTSGTITGVCYIRPVLTLPDELVSRLAVTIAAGTDYDDMSSKPADSAFSNVITANLSAGAYQPIWVKRTILPAGETRKYYTNIPLSFTVSTV